MPRTVKTCVASICTAYVTSLETRNRILTHMIATICYRLHKNATSACKCAWWKQRNGRHESDYHRAWRSLSNALLNKQCQLKTGRSTDVITLRFTFIFMLKIAVFDTLFVCVINRISSFVTTSLVTCIYRCMSRCNHRCITAVRYASALIAY